MLSTGLTLTPRSVGHLYTSLLHAATCQAQYIAPQVPISQYYSAFWTLLPPIDDCGYAVQVFGYHEVFHAFVVLASILHFTAVFTLVQRL